MQSLPHLSSRAPLTLVQPTGSISLDWTIAVLSTWMIGGIHLDAWTHHQCEVETFFTPWHGVLYTGFLATALALVGVFVRNLWRHHSWQQATPSGYRLSLYGVMIFLAGGVGDMLWHIVFGIENNIEVLISPTHLPLALGGALITTGPLCAPDGRAVRRRWDG